MLLRVPRTRAGEALGALRRLRLLDGNRRSFEREGRVYLPVLEAPPAGLGELVEGEAPPRERQEAPYRRIHERAAVPAELRHLLPSKWERLGSVLVLRLPPPLLPHAREVAEAYAGVLGVQAVLRDASGIRGERRRPSMELLLGEGTETVHLEGGVRYRFDAATVMFSSGNIAERMGMGRAVRKGETVADLFAGIGYFTLPMAVSGKPRKIHACEIDPRSHGYLEQNIRLNRVGHLAEARLGDCREVAPEGVADRVVMGHFDSVDFIPKALRVLRPEGGVLHVHRLCRKDLIEGEAFGPAKRAIEMAGREARLLGISKVKSFKPRVWHVALEVGVGPVSGG